MAIGGEGDVQGAALSCSSSPRRASSAPVRARLLAAADVSMLGEAQVVEHPPG